MARFLAVSTSALWLALLCAMPVSADRVQRTPKRVSISSLQDFETCQKAHDDTFSEACLEGLKVYIKKHPHHAFKAGKLVRVHYMYWEALQFFASALRDKPTKRQCSDEDLRAAVLSGLALPPHYPEVALAQDLVSGPCRTQLESPVMAQMSEAGRVFRNNACPVVSEQVRAAQCGPQAETLAEAEPATSEPTKEELISKSPALREAPPERREATAPPPVQPLEDVFPARPESKVRTPHKAALAELPTRD